MSLRRRVTYAIAALTLVATPLWAARLLAAARPAHTDAALDELARDVDRTESLRAVLNLQRTYAQYAQAGLWTEVGALFAPDGSFVFDGLIKPEQTAKGPAAIAGFLRTRYGGGHEGLKADGLSTMMIDAPVANLSADGDSAKVRWETWIFHGPGGQARVEGGVFENDYVREGGVWKIAEGPLLSRVRRPLRDRLDQLGRRRCCRSFRATTPSIRPAFRSRPRAAPRPRARRRSPRSRSVSIALNDEDRIRNLQSAYGFYQDRKMWDDVVDLFADDGVVEVGGQGVWRGKAGVRRWLETHGPGRSPPRAAQRPRPVRRDRRDRAWRQRGVGARHRARHAGRSGPGAGLVGSRHLQEPLRQGRRRVEGTRAAALPAVEGRRVPGLGQESRIVASPIRPCPRSSARIPSPESRSVPAGSAKVVAASALTGAIAAGTAGARSRSRRPGGVSPARRPSTAS